MLRIDGKVTRSKEDFPTVGEVLAQAAARKGEDWEDGLPEAEARLQIDAVARRAKGRGVGAREEFTVVYESPISDISIATWADGSYTVLVWRKRGEGWKLRFFDRLDSFSKAADCAATWQHIEEKRAQVTGEDD